VGDKGGTQVTVTAAAQPATPKAGFRLRLAGRATPVQLRIATASIAVLALVAGLLAALATAERQSATQASWQTAEPLMVTGQAIDSSLSDADTTAAASFLKGRIETAQLQSRYASDLTTASSDIATAAQQAGSDPAVASSLRTLSVDLPAYAGLIQEADFNERQASYPLAAAYLSEANNLMRTSMLPAAAQVYGNESARLSSDQTHAVSPALVTLAAWALVALVVCLVVAQRWLSRRFRRTWNVALVGATVIVLVLGVWSVVAVTRQNIGVSDSSHNGSHAVSTFTQARILALRMRADDELTLLTRDSDPSFQTDYTSTAAGLGHLLSSSASQSAAGSFERAQLQKATRALAAYRQVHGQIRRADAAGQLPTAVAAASSDSAGGLPAISSQLDSVLSAGIGGAQSTFDDSSSGAGSDLDGLVWALAIGSILAALLVVIGFQPRIAEYR
jgi:hypothetical protein